MAKVYITDLVAQETWQGLKKLFTEVTGIPINISDENGIMITTPIHKGHFCRSYVLSSSEGRRCCEECIRGAAKNAVIEGQVQIMTCHQGVNYCLAPITVDGVFLGAVSGAQCRLEDVDEATMKKNAKELGIEFEIYEDAYLQIPEVSYNEVLHHARKIEELAHTISDLIAPSFRAKVLNEDIQSVANIKVNFLKGITSNIHEPLREIIMELKQIRRLEQSDEAKDGISAVEKKTRKILNVLADMLEYSELAGQNTAVSEIEYDPVALSQSLKLMYAGKLMNNDKVQFELELHHNVPYMLFGDVGRIRQILINILNNSVQYTEEGTIRLIVDSEPHTYGCDMIFTVKDTGMGMEESQVNDIMQMFETANLKSFVEEDVLAFGLGITSQLLVAVNGSIQVSSKKGEGTTFVIRVPQLEI